MALDDFFNELGMIRNQGNPQQQIAQPSYQYGYSGYMPQSIQGYNFSGYGNNGTYTGAGTSTLDRLMGSIRRQESSGNYQAVNPDSGALGAYQVMPDNLPEWSKQALGHSVSSDEFLNSPSEQDAIARVIMGGYLNQYGPSGAAAAWYGGPGAVKNMGSNTPQGNYPSIYNYWNSVLGGM